MKLKVSSALHATATSLVIAEALLPSETPSFALFGIFQPCALIISRYPDLKKAHWRSTTVGDLGLCQDYDPFRNGNYTTYTNGDDWGMVYSCFTHSIQEIGWCVIIHHPNCHSGLT